MQAFADAGTPAKGVAKSWNDFFERLLDCLPSSVSNAGPFRDAAQRLSHRAAGTRCGSATALACARRRASFWPAPRLRMLRFENLARVAAQMAQPTNNEPCPENRYTTLRNSPTPVCGPFSSFKFVILPGERIFVEGVSKTKSKITNAVFAAIAHDLPASVAYRPSPSLTRQILLIKARS